ncbi:hypothetical protein PGT21_014122 [Puccinia graminis f. sp. tritici]|uniref:Uncharacterized protein n=1 Tax=Puccinia graminis f. sp. tritici TaxID=56615 RepID=A0A5B0P6U3_PUCGR|nr:hypothetical protein PGT21_014122 [Puccinia graminis f. sp. tritici]
MRNQELLSNKKKRKVPSTNQQQQQQQQQTTPNKPTTFTFQQTTSKTTNNNNNLDLLLAQDEQLKLSSSSSSLVDPITLAKILSSHHVRMKKRPISSPRHYGRHLHKLSQSRSSIDQLQLPLDHNTKTTPTSKLNQPRPQPKKINKRSINPNHPKQLKPPSSRPQPNKSTKSSPLKLPILPNLYDPSLPIDYIYPHRFPDSNDLSKIKNLIPEPQQNTVSFLPSDYNGQFTFRLEMHQICQRLLGLHLAISNDKKNRAVQIQEAMRIAMERLDRTIGPESLQLDQAQQDRARMAKIESARRPASQAPPSTHPPMTDQRFPPEHRRRTRRSSSSTTDHGPSGPPPTEPPPPLPQPALKSRVPGPPTGGAQVAGNPDVRAGQGLRKNKKKGKKKRSAHANANNIHHRDNYVPSRLPTSYPVRSGTGRGFEEEGMPRDWARVRLEYEGRLGRGFIDPTAAGPDEPGGEALSSTGARKAHCQLGRSPIARFFVEPDEWICSFCEYELWFGDPLGLIRVIKNRKDVLRRRRRAKERAARAASGIPPSTTHPPPPTSTPHPPASAPAHHQTSSLPPAPAHSTTPSSVESNKIRKKSKNNNFPTLSLPQRAAQQQQQQHSKPVTSSSPSPASRRRPALAPNENYGDQDDDEEEEEEDEEDEGEEEEEEEEEEEDEAEDEEEDEEEGEEEDDDEEEADDDPVSQSNNPSARSAHPPLAHKSPPDKLPF